MGPPFVREQTDEERLNETAAARARTKYGRSRNRFQRRIAQQACLRGPKRAAEPLPPIVFPSASAVARSSRCSLHFIRSGPRSFRPESLPLSFAFYFAALVRYVSLCLGP
ncbi:hypothetical protein FA10DRAFT_265456 [Acaromyces ingoldii]|uniref:Uncharacterized protein n=1 Tax=Acaromyces ingoldii TaxID=215250 RepID=A0A316YQF2_9BASI|nr:hypothetical protein FA10DRAFT_265456 [Acaromyces ingoldii]PWN91607.1 hypothetical protein FA10DRAFT_265456 [Acaromyces ingoldii]